MSGRPRFAAQRSFWAQIRKLRVFGIADLCGAAGSEDAAKMFVRRLRQNGIVEALPPEPAPHRRDFPPSRYKLIKDLGQRCPRFATSGAISTTPTAQERLWAAMRPLRSGFTVAELASLARCPRDSAKTYITALFEVGYLERIATEPFHRFRLRKACATGPEPPVRVPGGVWDMNLDRLIPARPVEVAA